MLHSGCQYELSPLVSVLKLDIFKYSEDCSVSHHTGVNILCLICFFFTTRRIITGQEFLTSVRPARGVD